MVWHAPCQRCLSETDTVIKLTKKLAAENRTQIRIEGALCAETVRELLGMLGDQAAAASTTLDLSGVASVDREGRELLLKLRQSGYALVGASMYLKRLLQEV